MRDSEEIFMKPPEELTRLLDEPGLESELGNALRGLSARLPSAESLASIASAVGAAPPPAAAGTPVLKLALATGALVTAGAVVALFAWTPAERTTDGRALPVDSARPGLTPTPAVPASEREQTANGSRTVPNAT